MSFLRQSIDELIQDTVIYLNEPVLDDMIPDLLADETNREEAIDLLINKLTQIKEGNI